MFNESQLFHESGRELLDLKEEFRLRFLNISRIMDCVGCDKCRMWGKLQVSYSLRFFAHSCNHMKSLCRPNILEASQWLFKIKNLSFRFLPFSQKTSISEQDGSFVAFPRIIFRLSLLAVIFFSHFVDLKGWLFLAAGLLPVHKRCTVCRNALGPISPL